MSASIELNFYYIEKNIDKYQLSFQEEKQEIKDDSVIVDIPESVFKYGKDKSPMKITLFETNSTEKNEYDFHVYYGENLAYVDISGLNMKTYEIIFKSIKNLTISGNGIKFTKLDTIKNRDKKRLVLINWDATILKVNEKRINLVDIININCAGVHLSCQLSEIDYKENKFIVKPFEKKKEYNFSLLTENKDLYKSFVEELDKLEYIIDETTYKNELKKLIDGFKDLPQYDIIYFNKTTEFLNELFDKNENYCEIFFNYFTYLFFYENTNMYINKKTIPFRFINIIKEKFDEIKEQKQIKMNEKISALNALFLTNGKLENKEDLDKLNIKIYFNTKKNLNKDSILGRAIKFLNQYIKCLNRKSIVYENLSYLDGGYGYYNKEKVYTYDLTNLTMLKSHLKKLIPKILIFCYMENNEIAFTAPEFNGIVINEYHLLSKYKDKITSLKIDYNKSPIYFKKDTKITENDMDDIAVDIALELIHEIMGHKKNELVEVGNQSPKKILLKKEIIELKHVDEFKSAHINDKCEYILTTNNGKGDSGHFLELSYGKIDNTLITKLLFDMKDKGKLIYRPDLFTDDGKKIKNYVYLRTMIIKRNLVFNSNDNDKLIEEDIEEMNNLILNSKKPEDNNKILIKEKKIEDDKVIENKNEFLNKKRNNESAFEINKFKPEKKSKLNLLKIDNNFVIKNEDQKDENDNDEDELPFLERIKNKSRVQIIEECRKRVFKRFKFKFDDNLRYNMIQKLKQLDKNDSYYHDLIFLIEDSRKIV